MTPLDNLSLVVVAVLYVTKRVRMSNLLSNALPR